MYAQIVSKNLTSILSYQSLICSRYFEKSTIPLKHNSPILTFQKLFPFAGSTQRSKGKNPQMSLLYTIKYLGVLWWNRFEFYLFIHYVVATHILNEAFWGKQNTYQKRILMSNDINTNIYMQTSILQRLLK